MDGRELRPRHRNHLGRRIQLHRARAERNHRAIEADVLALEALQVAHHLRFRPMRREDRMRHERRLARERIRHCARRFGVRDAGSRLPCRLGEHGRNRQHVAQASSFRRARCRCASCRSTGSSIPRARRSPSRRRSSRRCRPAPGGAACRSTSRSAACSPAPWRRFRASRRGRAFAARSPSGRQARDTRRTSPRCSRAAPAPCRCSTSPSRAGCAARASAAPCDTRDCRANRPTRR